MPILIDGNNLLHSLPPHQRSREAVRQKVLDQSRREKISVTVVFDGPPPDGSPEVEHLGQVTIIYSGPCSADDVIIDRLPTGGTARSWFVVTNDRNLSIRVRERGASIRSLTQWTGRRGAKTPPGKPRPKPRLRSSEVHQWEKELSEGKDTENEGPTRVFRPRRRR